PSASRASCNVCGSSSSASMTASVRAAVDQTSTMRSGSFPTDHSTAGFTAPSLRDVLQLTRELGEIHPGQGLHQGRRGRGDVHDAADALGWPVFAHYDVLLGGMEGC